MADEAQSALTTAYNDAAGRRSDGAISPDLAEGPTLDDNVFTSSACSDSTATSSASPSETSEPTPTPTPDETSSVRPSASATETQPATDRSTASGDNTGTHEGGSGFTGGSGSLADTGSGGFLSLLAPVGVLLVFAAMTILAVVPSAPSCPGGTEHQRLWAAR